MSQKLNSCYAGFLSLGCKARQRKNTYRKPAVLLQYIGGKKDIIRFTTLVAHSKKNAFWGNTHTHTLYESISVNLNGGKGESNASILVIKRHLPAREYIIPASISRGDTQAVMRGQLLVFVLTHITLGSILQLRLKWGKRTL